ncbi:MAG: hypothetical protein GC154_14250 [bacterium]|nr:hypothetical protein [bacterium]
MALYDSTVHIYTPFLVNFYSGRGGRGRYMLTTGMDPALQEAAGMNGRVIYMDENSQIITDSKIDDSFQY